MRIARSTLIGTAVAMALFGRNGAVQAQQAGGDQTASKPNELQEVVVTGIRASVQEALTVKKQSTNVIDVVTAEDIGKMPDKNVADSLKRVPGVTVSPSGANEGGFDENDRISLRGTNPSYTQLPSELVSKVVVNKSSEADLVEGGVAGTVDIVTRKPLDDFKQAL